MFFHTPDLRLAYDDQGTGVPLVFLHAFPLNRSMWAPQVAGLSRQFRTITIDLRGHGESDAPLWAFSLDHYADDVCALLDHLSHSTGSLGGPIDGRLCELCLCAKIWSPIESARPG